VAPERWEPGRAGVRGLLRRTGGRTHRQEGGLDRRV